MQSVVLGPFELVRPLGKGGMSEVWLARHQVQDVEVAVKVMTAEGARREEYRAAFRNEVRAAARLDHPAIIMVFDYGEVTPAQEASAGGALLAGSPYLVMERASRALPSNELLPWSTLRELLLTLLDALAHAHARGVVHRDLKPGNILVTSDPRHNTWKLADFGVAHAMDRTNRSGTTEDVYGTPAYMAPEQFWGRWRDYGPWTDLYALGCVAWRLCTGRLPFEGRTLMEMAQGHLNQPPPPFEPARVVPPELEAWLRRVLQKEPQRRYQRAADAAWGLLALGEVEEIGGVVHTSEEVELTSETTTLVLRREDVDVVLPPAPSEALRTNPGEVLSPRMLPSMPRRWERHRRRRSMRLMGAGLGLYGLRKIPLVGRERERDVVWRNLRRVREDGDLRMVLLCGRSGCGRSALAEWMCQRAEETGAAVVVKASHSPMSGSAEGLPRMVARNLQCVGLSRDEVLGRVQDLLERQGVTEPYEAHALTELMLPARDLDQGESPVRFASPTERYVLIRRLLERVSRGSGERRPVILWLEDVQWGADALGFVEHLFQAERIDALPVLVLLTAHQEVMRERPLEGQLMTELLAWPKTTRVELEPLRPAEHHVLVREHLGLSGDLAVRVEERTEGNPLFTVELVGDWIQRGVLVPTAEGFALKPGEALTLPDSLHEVWRDRVVRLLPEGQGGLQAVEVASILGQEVDTSEWRAVCELAGVLISPDLVERLTVSGVVATVDGGFAFTHGFVRESLNRSAREAGRWEGFNRACAETLRHRGRRGSAARVGRHLVAAGDWDRAVEPLLQGARILLETCDYRQVEAVLAEREAALEALGRDATSPEWWEGDLLRGQAMRETGRLDRARDEAVRVQERARKQGRADLVGAALLLRGQVASTRGELVEATRLFNAAQTVYDAADEPAGAARAWAGLAEVKRTAGEIDDAVLLFRGVVDALAGLKEPRDLADALISLGKSYRQGAQLSEAQAAYERALLILRSLGNQRGLAGCLRGLGAVAELRGELEPALRLYRESLDICEGIGDTSGRAAALNSLAEISRRRGDLEGAERGYREALRVYESIGDAMSFVSACNLGLVLIAQQRYPESRAVLSEALREVESQGRQGWAGAIHAMLLVSSLGDVREWFTHLGKARNLLRRSGFTDPDIVWALEQAAGVARDAGRSARAVEALELALRQCELQGDSRCAQELRDQLAALGSGP